MTAALVRTGRAWVFGDAINTDDMFPGFAMRMPIGEAAQHMFDASRPDWPSLVEPGDIVVAGRSFGLGSSRPVPLLFRSLGVAALVAEEFNTLFYRNCINYGLPALTVAGAASAVVEGDTITVDLDAAQLRNETTGNTRSARPVPELLLEILRAGGLISQLEASGRLRPAATR